MKIPKKKFYAIISLIFFIVALGSALLFYVSSPYSVEKADCKINTPSIIAEECGYITTVKDNTYSIVLGRIINKYSDSDKLFIEFVTADSKGKSLKQKILLPDAKDSISLGEPSGNTTKFSNLTSKQLFNQIILNQLTTIDIHTPSDKIIQEMKKKNVNLLLAKCAKSNELFINYLKNPNIVNLSLLQLNNFASQCNPTTIQMIIF